MDGNRSYQEGKGMARIPDDSQLTSMLSELREALDQLEHGAVLDRYDAAGRRVGTRRTPNLGHLFILVAAARKDGWYTGSLGNGPPSSSAKGDVRQGLTADGHWVDLDAWEGPDEPIQVRTEYVPTPPHSDRVASIAADPVKVNDPIREHADRLVQSLARALGEMRRARGSMIAAFEDVKPQDGSPPCRAHLAAGIFEEATRTGRCDWCYRFWLAEKVTPPVELVRAKAEGRRITVTMVEEALGRGKAPKRKKVPA